MAFFDEPDEEQPRPHWNPPPPKWPEWRTEPETVLPGVAPIEVVIGRGPDTVVVFRGVLAYPTGMTVTIEWWWRPASWDRDLMGGPDEHATDKELRERLLWGIEFSDGRKVTNASGYPYPDGPAETIDGDTYAAEERLGPPHRPVLTLRDGSGVHGRADVNYWVWPLPPPGPLKIACEWIDRGIEETVTEIDAAPIIDAAARAQPIWP